MDKAQALGPKELSSYGQHIILWDSISLITDVLSTNHMHGRHQLCINQPDIIC